MPVRRKKGKRTETVNEQQTQQAELHLVAHQWLNLLFKLTLAEALKEVTTSISKQARLNDEYAIYICLYYVH